MGKFKEVVALTRNLDILDFIHNAYIVNKKEFPIKAMKTNVASICGKRKIVEILDSKDEAHDEPNCQDPNPNCVVSF